ncbi:MAG: hypothetical protein M5U19_21405 [Microthrixaceae bacterium]|nr:hypothetical protein [Microthrixaceae bacterium]
MFSMSCHQHLSTSVDSPASPGRDEAERARRHSVEHRREVLAGFFSGGGDEGGHPTRVGPGSVGLPGMGDPERPGARRCRFPVVVGRQRDLVDDLAAAADGGADGPWRDYLASPPRERQSRLWRAHQYSIGRGASAAQDLLVREVPTERAFIEIALGVVESAAAAELDTSRGSLGRRTAQLYPQSHPCCEADLERLLTELSR